MNFLYFSRCLTKGLYRACRVFVRLAVALVILAIMIFVFLRVYGVPEPLLRVALRHVNTAGIPVDVDGVTLTLHGWRADGVRCYSENPDDLEPIFELRQVFFSARSCAPTVTGSNAWNLEVKAVGVAVNPSLEWGMAIPRDSPALRIEKVEVSLGVLPDRIVFSNGKMDWLGSRFRVNGMILKNEKTADLAAFKQKIFINEQQFQTLETCLKMLSLPNGATVDVDFEIDTTDYSASWVDLSIGAEEVAFREIGFSRAEIVASYTYPTIQIDWIGLFQGKQSVQLSGKYNLNSKEIEGSLCNTITSNRLLLLLPEKVQDSLAMAEFRIDHLPSFEIDFGPAMPTELLNHFSGVFSIPSVGFQGIEIEELRGKVKRGNNRLEFTELKASVLGQEEQAGKTGSAMHGGFAAGSVFWDGNTRAFGVDVEACFDPHILMQTLSPIKIATNIIHRFRFDQPPRGHVTVGMDLDDSSSFYINIQAEANTASIQEVEFSSVNVTQTYRHGKLTLDPIAAMQGSKFIKGSVVLDFYDSTATFDAYSQLNPTDLEDLIYPNLNLFGTHIKTSGDVRMVARGKMDWGSMQQTDFSIQVEADKLEVPVGSLDRFSAEVVGTGATIAVKNSKFGFYGGEGEGEFSVKWNPAAKNLPYKAGFSFSEVDFRQFLVSLRDGRPVKASGKMGGTLQVEADLSTNFFATASGAGFICVKDGQLADLPLFDGFSKLMRKVFPVFTLFSITSLRGNFIIEDGKIFSEDVYLEGDVLSAKGQGFYCQPTGFDALVQVQMFSESMISKVVRAITDPLLKIFEMKLTGTLSEPSWKLEKFQ